VRNINVNQFALPGMEEHAHPGARHLKSGVMFHHETTAGRDIEDPSFHNPGEHRHWLFAHRMGAAFDPSKHIGNALGHIQWAGEHDQHSFYPGEIQYIERQYGGEHRRGLMTDLYKMGHEVNFGQSTVPTHSPTRTPEGERWSKNVGGPRPERKDYDWKPPEGIHPYEQRNLQTSQFKPPPEQGQLWA